MSTLTGSEASEKLDEADFDNPKFDYVVELKHSQKICFGSTVERNTDPIGKGLSPFQKLTQAEMFPNSPASYKSETYTSALYPVLHKIRSKKGVGSLASKDKRFKDKIIRTPSPGRYETIVKSAVNPGFAPFGTKATPKKRENNIPGPATYNLRKIRKCRRTRFMDNFGRPSMIYAVETFCIAVPTDTCQKCEEVCEGDYWHYDYTTFLCQLCWQEEKYIHEFYSKERLREFKKIRNCSFMHDHQGTDAAIIKLHPKKIKKKLRLENYLDLYIDC